MVDPEGMCDRHLLGEHYECHMFAGCLDRGKSLAGYLRNNLFDPSALTERHETLVGEMTARGFCHRSPISRYTGKPNPIDMSRSLRDLLSRCPACRARHKPYARS